MKIISTKQTRWRSATIIIMIVLLTGCAASTVNDGKTLECNMLGGETIAQPSGSSITACCYDNGCWICDENHKNCDFEPAFFSPAWKDAPFYKAYQR